MDLSSADVLWSIFISSLKSYRRDSVLRPFPPSFLTGEGEKEFDNLLKVATSCPSLEEVNKNPNHVSPQLLELLRWVLNPKNFNLKSLTKDKFEHVHKLVVDHKAELKIPKPDYIFGVEPSNAQKEKFQSVKGTRGSIYAFHGSKIENFHSILNCGLRNNLNKVGLFGEGIYLSSDLSLVLNYSPTGPGWVHSRYGESLSCVALCEMIDHPDVKCTLKRNSKIWTEADTNIDSEIPLDGSVQTSGTSCLPHTSNVDDSSIRLRRNVAQTDRRRSKIAGSEGGEIPEKYFVVRNDDLVRVKYLLLYCPQFQQSVNRRSEKTLVNFFRRHQFLFLMIFYVLILLIPSLYGSSKMFSW